MQASKQGTPNLDSLRDSLKCFRRYAEIDYAKCLYGLPATEQRGAIELLSYRLTQIVRIEREMFECSYEIKIPRWRKRKEIEQFLKAGNMPVNPGPVMFENLITDGDAILAHGLGISLV